MKFYKKQIVFISTIIFSIGLILLITGCEKYERDNLIDPRLGNNGHYGLGCYVESKISLFHNFVQRSEELFYMQAGRFK